MKKTIHFFLLWFVLTSLSPPQDHAKEIKLSEKIPKTLKSVGEKAVKIEKSIVGALKDSVVKMHEWDFIDSPKRICEDIKWNISRNNEYVKRSVSTICDIVCNVTYDDIKLVISWCHLLGFSTAYGIGVWVTFSSGCVLGCLPKQQFCMMINKMNMVCFRASVYCVGAALLGFLASKGTLYGDVFSNKMVMFQVFNLVSALCMMLTNLIFLEPRATKCIAQRKKEIWLTKSVAAKKLRKVNSYSSTLSMSTVVVLTWHLAYISQMLQARPTYYL